ncbi:HEAT repeat domain-containing protein [Candidatus Micrarchaeota archaeon]|nr:HEAT repeat domain-containing protein [Candidatus Micrarchaeota archaeon]
MAKDFKNAPTGELIAVLENEAAQSSTRLEAIKELGRRKEPEAATALSNAALHDKSADVRRFAAMALGEANGEKAFPILIKLLQDESPGVREASALALGRIGGTRPKLPGEKKARDALLNILKDKYMEDAQVRAAAASSLGWINMGQPKSGVTNGRKADAEVISSLINVLGDDEGKMLSGFAEAFGENARTLAILRTEILRVKAAEALGTIGNRSAVPSLIKALGDENPNLVFSATGALGKIGGTKSRDALLNVMEDEKRDVKLRAYAAFKLGQISGAKTDAKIVSALIKALESGHEKIRESAANSLGIIGDASSIPALVKTVLNDNAKVRRSAAGALRSMGAKAVPALLEVISEGENPFRRGKTSDEEAVLAVKMLMEVGDSSALPQLEQAMRHGNEAVKNAAYDAIRAIEARAEPETTASKPQKLKRR